MYIENSCSDYNNDDGSSKIIAVSVSSSYSDSDSDSDESELLVSSSPLEVNSAWKASRAFGCLAILIGGFSWMYLWYHIYYYQYYKSSSDAAAGEGANNNNDITNNDDSEEEEEEEEHKRRRWISEEITQARIIGGIFFVAAFYQGLTLFFLRSSICNTNGNGDGSIELRQKIGSSAEIIFGTNCSMSSGAHMTIASTVLWVVSGTLLCLGRQQRMRVDDDIDDDDDDDDASSEVQQEQGNRLDNEASSNADREDQATQNNGSAVDTDSVPIIDRNENTVDNKHDAENQTTSTASQLMRQTESVESEEQPPQITTAGNDNITCAVDSLAISAMTELESQTQNHSRVTTSSKSLSLQTKKKQQQSKLPQTRRRRYRS